MVELSQRYQEPPDQIRGVESRQLLDHAADICGKDQKADSGVDVKDLQAKIGQLSMENDFLAVALGRVNDGSAKR
ncbi:MAG: hypothetical protein RBS96_05140 [Dehalococcoidales bacterium]|nr:hypothetical protein [Syntrophales bacterium]MDX9803394.1 hypothetical protein [Dehalococcoidales bacterium]